MKYTSKLILNWEEYQFAAPEQWWQPWANTLCYFSLNGTADDSSSNQYTWTWSGNENYETLSSWIQVAKFDGSSYITTSRTSLMNPSDFSILIRFKRDSTWMTFLLNKWSSTNTWENLHCWFYGINICININFIRLFWIINMCFK